MAPKKAAHTDQVKLLSDNAAQLAEVAATALRAAEKLGIKSTPIGKLAMTQAQVDILLAIPKISKPVKNKLAKDNASFTVADVTRMVKAVAENLMSVGLSQQVAHLRLGKQLTDKLQAHITRANKNAHQQLTPQQLTPRKVKASKDTVYQFKLTLIGSNPPIWRRIQVEDCTLDKLHEHIQSAMGWTNSHLHRFEIFKKQYGDPELLDDGFEDYDCLDSTEILISEIISDAGKRRLKFTYEYDFGDDWEHEILFEGSKETEAGKKYPLCLEGERACPPEDVGGIYGYYDFLEAITNPEHEEHDSYTDWARKFNPEEFDPKKATREMKKGLPDWRD